MALSGGIAVAQEVDAGGRAWVRGPGAAARQPVDGPAAAPLRWVAMFHGPAQIREVFPGAAVDGVEHFDGRSSVRLRLGQETDAPVVLLDAATWLPRGMRFRAPTPLGVLDAVTYYRDYRAVGGVLLPRVVVSDVGGQQTEIRLERVERR